MQEQAAEGVVPPPALRVAAAVDALRHPDGRRRGPPEDELGRVLQQQDRPRACPEPIARRREVTAEDVGLVHPRVGEEPVGRLGSCPVAAGLGYAGAYARGELPQQAREAPLQPRIREAGGLHLRFGPVLASRATSVIARGVLHAWRHRTPSAKRRGARQRITADSAGSSAFGSLGQPPASDCG